MKVKPDKIFLLLFDIDGTLVRTGGAGKDSMEKALYKVFNIKNGLDSIPMMGRTDPLILKDALAKHGIVWDRENENKLKQVYFEIIKNEIIKPRKSQRVLPGIEQTLELLSGENNIYLGLLTGNYRISAYIKINRFNLGRFFPFGAFADDSQDRNKLGRFAIKRFEKKYGFIPDSSQVFIIGDTPSDIACAAPYNFKTVAVATGIHSFEELKEHNPDFVFRDFRDYENILHKLKVI